MSSLILVRGLPGSGKSTLAEKIADHGNGVFDAHFEADMYFMGPMGYNWVATEVGKAHAWCQNETRISLINGLDVVVSNTFTTISELRPYFEIAKSCGIVPTVITCQNEFGNVHNVPQATLDKMKTRFQHNISQLFEEYK